MGKFGWDLPPGCCLSDIPGNRPEDEAWEDMVEGFFENLSEGERGLVEGCEEVVIKAIEYGIDAQIKEQKRMDEENKFYEERAREYQEGKEVK